MRARAWRSPAPWAALLALGCALPAGAQTNSAPCSVDTRQAVLRTAYYPSHRLLRALVDVSRFPAIEGAKVSVANGDAGRALASATLSFGADRRLAEARIQLPPLEPGSYEVQVGFAQPDCPELAGPRERFDHQVFGWEDNTLGRADVVIPPFTALEADEESVVAVGRHYRHAPGAVFGQLRSGDAGLLAAPARLRIRSAGRELPLEDRGETRLRSATATQVVHERKWAAGPLLGHQRWTTEIDGLVFVDVSISGPPETPIDAIDLSIPLAGQNAALMTAVTDGTLRNQLGAIPPGSGVVWDSLQTGRHMLDPEFVPYIWIGDERRGLAWMAESTQDWMLADGVATQEIRRDGERVELAVRFVTRPGPLGRTRTLRFALQATPVKPRPVDWRRWSLDCKQRSRFRICALPSGGYWGAASPYGHPYPLDRDGGALGALAALRDGASLVATKARLRRWVEKRALPIDRRDYYRASLLWSASALATRPDVVIAYINPHGSAASPEYRIYVDEWRELPFGDRAGADANRNGEIKIVSAPSHHDYLLWHLDNDLLASGAVDGFFFDNTYLKASFDPVTGPAVREEDGRIRPGVDLFALRSFLRRAATLVYERRGRWTNLVHMTSTPISAVHGWAGVSLDGEQHYGNEPFQARFQRDTLRAASLGTQTGTVPGFLPGVPSGLPDSLRNSLRRSLAAMSSVHEIRTQTRQDGVFERVSTALEKAGYLRPKCRVERYWDEERTLQLEGVDAVPLLVACDGGGLILLSNAGTAGALTLRLDRNELGIPSDSSCHDAERRGPVETARDGSCVLTMDAYDLRLIRIGR